MDSTTSNRIQCKRIKERTVREAAQLVQLWRQYYEKGKMNSAGTCIKLSLQKSAEEVGVPKRTLEDYRTVLAKFQDLGYQLNDFETEKMGTIRQILRQQKENIIRKISQDNEIENYFQKSDQEGFIQQEKITTNKSQMSEEDLECLQQFNYGAEPLDFYFKNSFIFGIADANSEE